jgi:hypothetical protein
MGACERSPLPVDAGRGRPAGNIPVAADQHSPSEAGSHTPDHGSAMSPAEAPLNSVADTDGGRESGVGTISGVQPVSNTGPEADIDSIAGIVQRFFAAVSFELGQRPAYEAIPDLFVADGKLIKNSGEVPEVATVAEFIDVPRDGGCRSARVFR